MSINPIGYQAPNYNHLPTTTEQDMVSTIQRLVSSNFNEIQAAGPAWPVPENDVNQALNLFNQIQNRSLKIEAFASVIFATGCLDVKKFYNALPPNLQDEFKHQLWIANGRSDNGKGLNFGDDFVQNFTLRSNACAMTAVRAMR